MLLRYYLVIVNVIAFVMFALDKFGSGFRRNGYGNSRLLWIAVCGGSLGAILGMYVFRHYVRDFRFWFGLPLILILQLFLFNIFFG